MISRMARPSHFAASPLALLASAVLALLLAMPAAAETPVPAAAAPAAPEAPVTASPALLDSVDALFKAEMTGAGIPCAAVALVKDGEVVYVKGYGEARPGVAADADTPFYIGSVTKSMTALGLMTLVDEGKVDLMAPVADYLPEFRMADPRFRAITVHDLLRQSSGLSTRQGEAFLGDPGRVTMRDIIGRLATEGLASEPGSRFEYSNLNYVLAGAVIEAVSGMPYARFMDERVFAPMGMTRTSASRADAERMGLAVGSRGFLGWTIRGNHDYPEGMVPGGYVASSVRDMAAYMAFMQKGGVTAGGARLISPGSFERMTTRQSATGAAYGYGWMVSPEAIDHLGEVAGFLTEVVALRDGSGWGWVVLVGRSDALWGTFLHSSVWRIEAGLDRLLRPGRSPLPPPGPLRMGTYRLVMGFIAALVIGLLALSCLGPLSLRRRSGRDAGRSGPHPRAVAGAFALHLVLPLAVLGIFPLVLGRPWALILSFALDFALLCLVLAAGEFLIGAVKVGLVLSRVKRSRRAA